jgi:hypothetical protein
MQCGDELMAPASARSLASYEMDTSATETARRANFPNFSRHYDEPEQKWEAELVRALVRLANLPPGWDSYNAPPMSRDAGHFALEILQAVMRPRTPLPQVVPSAAGGVQLEWHEKGVDLELHITAPYQWELWFRDHQEPDSEPVSLELTDDFSALKRPISLLTTR